MPVKAAAYGAGTLAYVDSFGPLVPVKVLEVIEPANGHEIRGRIKVKVTADRPGYRRGEVFTQDAYRVVPRKHVYTRRGQYRINTAYRWE
ncbi:hypothetical protein [Streptomyces sp. URMC 125]|uniref:hypothetical protein n=1 Tax=Streptomyces sp. URMC 125 TaxID=3423419 RepID=UPI003F1C8FC8